MAKYSKKIVKMIADLVRSDSYTIVEICERVGISESTFHEWKSTKSEFSESLKRAQEARIELFAAEAEKSLLKKIKGYTVQEVHTSYVDSKEKDISGKSKPKIKEKKVVDKHFQPDTGAIIFALTNGKPGVWKNRQNTEVTGKGGKDLFPSLDLTKLTTEELKQYQQLMKKANGGK